MRLDEVQTLMGEFNRHVSQDTQVLFGAAVDPTMGESLSVTILSSTEIAAPLPVRSSVAAEVRRPAVPLQRTARVSTPRPASPPREEVSESEESETSVAAVGGTDLPVRSPDAVVSEAPAPRPRPDARMGRRPGTEMAGGRREARQEQMQFEPASRGRFDKSEPTIVDGEDLDVPAFLRRTPRR
jgi:cell division protein FtsZ